MLRVSGCQKAFQETGFRAVGIRALQRIQCRLSTFPLQIRSAVRRIAVPNPAFLFVKSYMAGVSERLASAWVQQEPSARNPCVTGLSRVIDA